MKNIKNKGTGINQVILLTAILLFIFIPIFTVMMEKIHVKIIIHEFEEVGDMAVISAVSQLDTFNLAMGILSVEDINKVNDIVYRRIVENCNNIYTIDDFSFHFYTNNEICPYLFTSNYTFFHLYFTIHYNEIAYKQDEHTIHIHLDVEVPIDR